MDWHISHRADRRALPLADAHYSRQKPGTPQFVKPGRCIVLLTGAADALWVSSWPFAEHVKHAWAGAWECSLFRNTGPTLSSTLIVEAVAVTRWHWGDPPDGGMITFIDTRYTRSPNPGYCYKRAGWRQVGRTQGGLIALQLLPAGMPPAAPPWGRLGTLFADLAALGTAGGPAVGEEQAA
jgi:hypothetical protein